MNMPHLMKTIMGGPTRLDTNKPVQLQKLASGLNLV